MPWFKVDDTFAMHEKVMEAGNAAVGLWVRAGAWSMQQLTDGFVPNHVVRALGTPKERRQLVEVSLWVEAEGGVRFQNWEERQPTKVQVEAARQAAAERQRHARVRAQSRRDSQRSNSVSHGPPDPTRPDPTPKGKETGRRKRPATPLADDWKPTESHWERRHDGLDVQHEAATFRAHAEANDRRCVNWNAAFTQWLLKARPGQRATPQPHKGRAAQWLDLARELHAEEQTLEIGPSA
jgi:hypothetical protein